LKKLLFLLFFILVSSLIKAGDVVLRYNAVAVNIILSDLSSRYGAYLSFNESDLSEYKVSIDGTYSSVDKAIAALLNNLPFSVKKIEDIIVITPFKSNSSISVKDVNTEKKYLKGVVMSSGSGERLPYAYLAFQNRGFYSDRDGGFTLILPDNIDFSSGNRSLDVTVSYLGYNTITANLKLLENNRIYLNPAFSFLDTVTVKAYLNSKAMQTGNIAGLVRVNYNIARFLPGNGDNSVFNFLRMMPGVRSSGEPSFLSVWGSTNGESVIKIDGFRLFSMNNFNEQISSINPFIVKEIVLNKGGYDASKGDATGAIVDIIGVDGNSFKPTFKANINNLTMNLFTSVPFAKRSVVMASYRQTYYNLYDIDKLNPYVNDPKNLAPISINDIYIKPDYNFKDLNIRFNSLLSKNVNLTGSLYYAKDDFNYTLDYGDNTYDANESNNQYGLSFKLDKEWGGIYGKTSFTGYYSSNLLEAESVKRYKSQNLISVFTDNLIGEGGVDISHNFNTGKYGKLDVGISYKRIFDSYNGARSDFGKTSAFINDNFVIANLNVNLGLRFDTYMGKSYFQPRFQAAYTINENFKITASTGLYNQFINKVPYIDQSNNYSYIWKVADINIVPVISSFHGVVGASYSKRGWLITTEGYIKKSSDILRFGRYRGSASIVNTSIDVMGVDILIDKEIRSSNIFVSATLSDIKERPQSINFPERVYSPFEIKSGAVIGLYPFYISSTFIFGSGYINPYKNAFGDNPVTNDYNRFDISLNYRFIYNNFSLEAGVSILNLFNSSNYKYVDVLPFSSGGQSGVLNIYSQAIPFTPIASVQIFF
jgi:hypothetical protein